MVLYLNEFLHAYPFPLFNLDEIYPCRQIPCTPLGFALVEAAPFITVAQSYNLSYKGPFAGLLP
jgi:hypothetical protein